MCAELTREPRRFDAENGIQAVRWVLLLRPTGRKGGRHAHDHNKRNNSGATGGGAGVGFLFCGGCRLRPKAGSFGRLFTLVYECLKPSKMRHFLPLFRLGDRSSKAGHIIRNSKKYKWIGTGVCDFGRPKSLVAHATQNCHLAARPLFTMSNRRLFIGFPQPFLLLRVAWAGS